MLTIVLLMSCNTHTNTKDSSNVPTTYQQQLLDDGWIMGDPREGDMPVEYGVTVQLGIVDNYFDIELGGDADMVIKIVSIHTGETVRYIFVHHNSRTTINEIPAGKYYLKFAYGNNWMTHSDGHYAEGKFTRNVVYEKSNDYFEFGNASSLESVSFSLRIKVERDQLYEDFSTSTITEEEFNE